MISAVIQKAINDLNAEKELALEKAQTEALVQKIAPHNKDIDESLARAIGEVKDKYDKERAAIAEKENLTITQLTDAAAANKQSFGDSVMATVAATVEASYAKALKVLGGINDGN